MRLEKIRTTAALRDQGPTTRRANLDCGAEPDIGMTEDDRGKTPLLSPFDD